MHTNYRLTWGLWRRLLTRLPLCILLQCLQGKEGSTFKFFLSLIIIITTATTTTSSTTYFLINVINTFILHMHTISLFLFSSSHLFCISLYVALFFSSLLLISLFILENLGKLKFKSIIYYLWLMVYILTSLFTWECHYLVHLLWELSNDNFTLDFFTQVLFVVVWDFLQQFQSTRSLQCLQGYLELC